MRVPLKWTIANVLADVASRSGGLNAAQSLQQNGNVSFTALTYHRIASLDEQPNLDPTLASATRKAFSEQLDYLARHFTIVSGADVLAARKGQQDLPPRSLLLTFDDAYIDFQTSAWPELRKRGFPAVLFVPTRHACSTRVGFWWDKLHEWLKNEGEREILFSQLSQTPLAANKKSTRKLLKAWLKTLQPEALEQWVSERHKSINPDQEQPVTLGWDELRQLKDEGVEICPHTVTHPILTRLNNSDIRTEIEESHRQLKEQLGAILPLFAYPSGYTDRRVTEVCSTTAIEMAFTTRAGAVRLRGDNPWALNRINVSCFASPEVLRTLICVAQLRS